MVHSHWEETIKILVSALFVSNLWLRFHLFGDVTLCLYHENKSMLFITWKLQNLSGKLTRWRGWGQCVCFWLFYISYHGRKLGLLIWLFRCSIRVHFLFNDGFFSNPLGGRISALQFLYFLGPYKRLGPCCFADLHVLLLEDLLILLQKEGDKLVLTGHSKTLLLNDPVKVITPNTIHLTYYM